MIGFSIEKALVIFKDKNLQVANEKCNTVNEEITEILIFYNCSVLKIVARPIKINPASLSI
jgi:hypothetical protein